ncbi:MAG: CTP synthase, partial [Patescibacteria group bacterium]
PLDDPRKEKLGIFCNVSPENIISAPDEDSIYDIPVNFEKEHYGDNVLKILNLEKYNNPIGSDLKFSEENNSMKEWGQFAEKVKKLKQSNNKTKIGIVGKYFATGDFVLKDSYLSVIEAVKHAAWFNNVDVEIDWINSEEFEYENNLNDKKVDENLNKLKQYNGIIVPGGFGSRGIEGKLNAIKFIRENNIPYLGLCYGMQLATIEYARNVLNLKDANTEEINPDSSNCVIHIMDEQKDKIAKGDFGGTMRLGAYPCALDKNSISFKAYSSISKGDSSDIISERHRHRYEFNNKYREQLENAGLKIAGTSPDNKLVEIIEIPKNNFFVGVQFQPELKSRP